MPMQQQRLKLHWKELLRRLLLLLLQRQLCLK
jgi:hypothetical protein